jgi:heterodisulfide reductase subunit A-like polyferredoxin
MPDGKSAPATSIPRSPFASAHSINSKLNPSVLIIGAGIGGITLALDLDERGLTNWIVGCKI